MPSALLWFKGEGFLISEVTLYASTILFPFAVVLEVDVAVSTAHTHRGTSLIKEQPPLLAPDRRPPARALR